MTRATKIFIIIAFSALYASACTPKAADCKGQKDCSSCLSKAGCNWTGDQCSDVCLMDTSCFGSGNSAAPTCPKGEEKAKQLAVAKGVELVPGKRLGKIALGMSREEIQKIFGDKIEVIHEENGEAYLKAGTYRLMLKNDKVDQAQIALSDVGQVTLGDKKLKFGITLEQASKILPSCKNEHRRGATLYNCEGCGLTCPGRNVIENVEVSVNPMKPEPVTK